MTGGLRGSLEVFHGENTAEMSEKWTVFNFNYLLQDWLVVTGTDFKQNLLQSSKTRV